MGMHDDAVVFVFRGPDGVIAMYGEDAPIFLKNSEYTHLATVDPRDFITYHYARVEETARACGNKGGDDATSTVA